MHDILRDAFVACVLVAFSAAILLPMTSVLTRKGTIGDD